MLPELTSPAVESLTAEEIVYSNKIVAHSDWGVAKEMASRAERSIVILDSFFSEYRQLDIWIKKAIRRIQKRAEPNANATLLEVSIYMASPTTSFGIQRRRELERLSKDDEACIDFLTRKVSKAERKRFQIDFEG